MVLGADESKQSRAGVRAPLPVAKLVVRVWAVGSRRKSFLEREVGDFNLKWGRGGVPFWLSLLPLCAAGLRKWLLAKQPPIDVVRSFSFEKFFGRLHSACGGGGETKGSQGRGSTAGNSKGAS